MNLDQVLDEWDKDSGHDKSRLGDEALNIPRLHGKWLRILSAERLRLRKMQEDWKVLKLEKHEFYTQGPTKETQQKGWEFPSRGMVLNKDIPLYTDADKQVVEFNLKMAYQQEVVAAIELIFKSIQNRNWEIGRAIDWAKYQQGN